MGKKFLLQINNIDLEHSLTHVSTYAEPGINSTGRNNVMLVNLPYLRGPLDVAYLHQRVGIGGFFKGEFVVPS